MCIKVAYSAGWLGGGVIIFTRRFISSVCAACILFSCSGCSKGPSATKEPPSSPTTIEVAEGYQFYHSGYKIKSTITPHTVATLDPFVLEVYIDENGEGMGLAGYKDHVYDVIISANKLYVKVSGNVAIEISDIDGRAIPMDLQSQAQGASKLSELGFSLLDGSVSSYKTSNSLFMMENSYTKIDTLFTPYTVAVGNTMTVTDLVKYIVDTDFSTPLTSSYSEENVIPEKGSFWNNSWLGVTIHDNVYSIGDFCNPSTYFESIVPESVTPSYEYSGDTKVQLNHINYQSSDGRTSFLTTEGYVQTISTTSPFKFLSFESGMLQDDVKYMLGIRLKKDQQESWKPVLDGLEARTMQTGTSKTYIATYKDYTITFGFDTKTKTLNSLTISNYLDFVEEGAKH